MSIKTNTHYIEDKMINFYKGDPIMLVSDPTERVIVPFFRTKEGYEIHHELAQARSVMRKINRMSALQSNGAQHAL